MNFKEEYLEGLIERSIKEQNIWVSTGKSKITNELEKRLADIVGRHVTVVNSGTSALLVSLLMVGVGSGDKVAVSNYGYPAALNCVNFLGAEPVFIDVDLYTMCMSPDELKKNIEGVKAVICIEHNGFVGPHLDEIKGITMQNKIPLIEDSCASFGEQYAGRYGDLATLSFGPTKVVGCGEGGAIISDKIEKKKILDIISRMNYRMSAILQYLLLKQLDDLDGILADRKFVRKEYELNGILLAPGSGGGYISFHSYELSNMLKRANVGYLHRYYPYQVRTDHSRYLYENFFDIPFHGNLSTKEIKKVSNIIRICEKL
jgi:dTDP-4-amino-4,6-dideoxygalactose transaminase